MKSDAVVGGVKLFNGEENAEEGTRLKRGQVGGVVPIGKRKTFKSDNNQIQIVGRGKTEPQKNNNDQHLMSVSSDAIKKSPIQARKVKSEGKSKEIIGGASSSDSSSTDKLERSPIHTRKQPRSEAELRKSKSDSIKTTNESVAADADDDGNVENAIQHVLDESDGGGSGKILIDNGNNGADESCKDFDVCQEKVISSSSDIVGMVKSSPVHVDGENSDDVIDDEGGEEEEKVDEEIDIEMEKRSFDVKEINIPEPNVVIEPEKQKVVVNERAAPKKAVPVSTTRQFHQKIERPVSVPLTVKQSPPNRKHSTMYQNFSKANSSKFFFCVCELH